MKKLLYILFCTVVVISTAFASDIPKQKTIKTVIVIPPQEVFLRTAMALTKIRPVSICTYAFKDDPEVPVMRYWEKATGKWQDSDMDDYEAISMFEDYPERMLLVLQGKEGDEIISIASEWCFNSKSLKKPTIEQFADSLKSFFLLNDSEFKKIDPKTSKPGEVRVMSWNILYKGWEKKGHASWKERSASAVQILAKYRPDVVGLQEESKEQINYIRKALSEYTYLDPYKNKGGGLLIRTKAWRVIKSGKIAIPGRRQASWSLLESTRNRQQWMFYNAHLIHRTAANSAAHRMEGAKSIVKHIVSHAPQGVPVVFTGDFNALDDMPVMRYLAGDSESPVKMLNAFNLVHGADDPRGTYRGLSKEHNCDRIDHILINKDAAVQNAKIVYYDELPGIWPSDHYPIQAILKKKLPHTVEKEAITKTKKTL